MFEQFLGSLEQIRVRALTGEDERRRENGEEERETKKKNELNRSVSFYIGAGPGRFRPDPASCVHNH